MLSSGSFLRNAPKEICSELFYDGDLQRLLMSIPLLTRYDDRVTIVPTLGLGKIGTN
jgi:hypothetical protein